MAGETTDRVDPLRLDTIAFVLLLAVLPLVSYGTTQDIEVLWMFGLILLAVGALIPLITEFSLREDDEEGENDEDGEITSSETTHDG